VGQPLIYCGSKVCSGQVRAHLHQLGNYVAFLPNSNNSGQKPSNPSHSHECHVDHSFLHKQATHSTLISPSPTPLCISIKRPILTLLVKSSSPNTCRRPTRILALRFNYVKYYFLITQLLLTSDPRAHLISALPPHMSIKGLRALIYVKYYFLITQLLFTSDPRAHLISALPPHMSIKGLRALL